MPQMYVVLGVVSRVGFSGMSVMSLGFDRDLLSIDCEGWIRYMCLQSTLIYVLLNGSPTLEFIWNKDLGKVTLFRSSI